MPASNGNWYISTVSSASSGHYNIDIDDGIPAVSYTHLVIDFSAIKDNEDLEVADYLPSDINDMDKICTEIGRAHV